MKLPINKIKSNPNNPRLIKDDKFKKLVTSIQEFPEMLDAREIVVNKDHIILGGNMRYKAAKEAGLKEVPVKIVDWSEEKQRQFVIKDNVSGGEWDWDILANEWDTVELVNWGLDTTDSFIDKFSDDFTLDSCEREEFGQMTFMLADIQKSEVEQALKEAPVDFADTYGNENSNGNKLYWIIKQWQQLKNL